MSKLQTTSALSVRYDGQDLIGAETGTTGGASGVARSTDEITLTLPAATVALIVETGSNKVNVLGASYSAVNAEHTIDSTTSTTIVFTIAGLDTAITGGETDPATEATIKVKEPDAISDPATLTTQTETNSQTSGTY
jgi:hypothetical protein